MAIDHSLTAIVRMKKSKMKYRLNINGENHLLCVKELHKQHIKGEWDLSIICLTRVNQLCGVKFNELK